MGDTVRSDDAHAFKRIAVVPVLNGRASRILSANHCRYRCNGIQCIKIAPQTILDGGGRLLRQLFLVWFEFLTLKMVQIGCVDKAIMTIINISSSAARMGRHIFDFNPRSFM